MTEQLAIYFHIELTAVCVFRDIFGDNIIVFSEPVKRYRIFTFQFTDIGILPTSDDAFFHLGCKRSKRAVNIIDILVVIRVIEIDVRDDGVVR